MNGLTRKIKGLPAFKRMLFGDQQQIGDLTFYQANFSSTDLKLLIGRLDDAEKIIDSLIERRAYLETLAKADAQSYRGQYPKDA